VVSYSLTHPFASESGNRGEKAKFQLAQVFRNCD